MKHQSIQSVGRTPTTRFLYLFSLSTSYSESALSVPLHRLSVVLPVFIFPVRSHTSSLRCLASFPVPDLSPYVVPPLSCHLSSSLAVPLNRPSVVLPPFIFHVHSLTSSIYGLATFPLPFLFPYVATPLSCHLSSSMSILLHRPSMVLPPFIFPYVAPPLYCHLSSSLSVPLRRPSVVLPPFIFPVLYLPPSFV